MKRYILIITLLLSVTMVTTAQSARRVRSGIILVDTGKTIRAIEPYKANYENGTAYAKIVNKYKHTFPNVNVYCMIIPNAVAFYCPDTAKTWTDAERPAISNILSNLSSDVKPVDIFETLQAHTEEYADHPQPAIICEGADGYKVMEGAFLTKSHLEELHHATTVIEVEDAPSDDYQSQTIEMEQGSRDIFLYT